MRSSRELRDQVSKARWAAGHRAVHVVATAE